MLLLRIHIHILSTTITPSLIINWSSIPHWPVRVLASAAIIFFFGVRTEGSSSCGCMWWWWWKCDNLKKILFRLFQKLSQPPGNSHLFPRWPEMQISKLVFLGEIMFYIAKIFCLAAFTILFHLETSLQGNKKGRVDKICHIRHLIIHLYLYVHILPYKKLAAKQLKKN